MLRCALRFLPPAYSISSRMLAQTPMSPYMSPISTYQVLKSAPTRFSYTICCTSILKYLRDSCRWGSTRRFWVGLVNVWQRAPWPFALVAVPTRSVGSTCTLEIADVLVFTECLCDVLGAEPLLGAPSGLHHATPGEKNRLDCHDFCSFFLLLLNSSQLWHWMICMYLSIFQKSPPQKWEAPSFPVFFSCWTKMCSTILSLHATTML